MVRLFKHYVPHVVLLLALVDFVLLLVSAEAAWIIRARQIDMTVEPLANRYWPILNFAVALQIAMVSVGVYGSDALQSLRFATARLLVSISLGVIFLSLVYFTFPGATLWRSNSLYAMAISFVLLVLIRILFDRLLGARAFRRRVVVLGAGQRAARLGRMSASSKASFQVVAHIDMNDCTPVVETAIDRGKIENLEKYIWLLGANEVVLALEERRRAMPVNDLLRIRTLGIHVNEISTFLERETGRVDLRSINPSWLIFSDGFSSARRLSSYAKRLFDIAVAATLLLLTLPVMAVAAIAVRVESPGPVIYRQQRIGLYGAPFDILKFRSMREDAEVGGKAIWAEKNDPRVTRVGRVIRKLRIDELPQVWTVLKGEMSFVGPRPERPGFVDELSEKIRFYAERHVVKPGITGWAQINYPYGASLDDARQKLEYDLYYAKNYTPFLDLVIILQTIRVVLFPEGAR